jgi:hypothetical protein
VSAEIIIDEGNSDDLVTDEPQAANDPHVQTNTPAPNWGDMTGTKLPPPALDVSPAWPDRPVIVIADGDLPCIVDAAEKVAAKHFYSRGKTIVRISEARELPEELKHPTKTKSLIKDRPDDQRVILTCAPSYLATEITRHADVLKLDARAKTRRKTDLNDKYATALLERKTWPTIRPLDAIVRAPFVRADGSICDAIGYDPLSRCFADFNPDEFYELPDEVSQDMAAEALATLLEPFDQFPYETPASLAAFAAHILTEVVRIAIPRAPCFWYSAQYAATGKTTLSSFPATITHGAEPAIRTWLSNGEELRKTLFASLLVGDRSLIFDNVPGGNKVRSAELCAFVTAPTWGDRKLGVSEIPKLPNKAVVALSGNNITPVSDLARRSLVIRLNANMTPQALKQRTFRITNLDSHVQEHRVELLMAALTVIKGHQQSGHVSPLQPLPSFVEWSVLVRDALLWLGMADPCDTQSETDDETDHLEMVFAMLAPMFADRPFTPGDVARVAGSMTDLDNKVVDAMREAGCAEPMNPIKVGYFLREARDKFGAGFQLRLVSSTSSTTKRYQFKPISPAQSTPIDNGDLTGGAP